MKELIVETVANGFLIRPPHFPSRDQPRQEIYVFSNPGQLTAWMEKWSIERKNEYSKKEVK